MKRRSSILTGSARGCRAWLPALALLAGLLLQAANACQVCIPFPTKTLADRLLEADALVLAREDPQRPFHYAVVEVLKGEPGDAPIDAFLPSVDRRVLARHPERRMLLARARPGSDWSALGIADADYERVVRRVLQHAGSWTPMETDNLAAWATAYLAIEGTSGVERIRHWYLERPERSREELREIVKALSVMAGADAALREPVAAGYRALLGTHPSLAADVTRDLIAWRRWDFVEQLRGIRKAIAKQDPLGAYALGLYLRSAAGAGPSHPALPGIVETGRTSIRGER